MKQSNRLTRLEVLQEQATDTAIRQASDSDLEKIASLPESESEYTPAQKEALARLKESICQNLRNASKN